jgi:hypothetical protein
VFFRFRVKHIFNTNTTSIPVSSYRVGLEKDAAMLEWVGDHAIALSFAFSLACLVLLIGIASALAALMRNIGRLDNIAAASMEQMKTDLEARRVETDPVRLALVALLAVRADRQMTHDDLQRLVQDLQQDTREIDALINEVRRLLGRSAAE